MDAPRTELPRESPIERAFRLAGGQAEVARRLGVSPQAVSKWSRRVPAERVLALCAAAGGAVQPWELRPDLYPREFATPVAA
jgi:DNA-binding transcriptional regulator YdaS (Cro superfamily)